MAHLFTEFKKLHLSSLIGAALLCASLNVNAESITYEVLMDDRMLTATVEVREMNETQYVSLNRLVDQVGGSANILPRRMRVDFAGQTAWVQTDAVRVKAMSVFTLVHPVLRNANDFLIAATDAPRFFDNAFHVSLGRREIAPPPEVEEVLPRRETVTVRPGGVVEIGDEAPPSLTSTEAIPSQASPRLLTRKTLRLRRPTERPIRVVMIDPGHGGADTGDLTPEGIAEKDIALGIASAFQKALVGQVTQEVLLSRSEDISLSLKQRASLSTKAQADLIVSIHVGGLFSPAASGYAFFYPPAPPPQALSAAPIRDAGQNQPDSMTLLSRQSAEIARQMAQPVGANTALKFLGLHQAPMRLFSLNNVLLVHVEVGCFTNSSDSALLASHEMQQTLGNSLASGLSAYLDDLEAKAQLSESFLAPTKPASLERSP